jgi:hypothetical protein
MPAIQDGPASSYFQPVPFQGNADLSSLARADEDTTRFRISSEMLGLRMLGYPV